MFLFWSLFIFTPSKKDALLIVAGGQTMNFLTTDSVAKQIPHELSNFVVTELKNMAAEAQVDLNIKDQKEKILEDAKNMSAKELVEKMKVDSTFAKVILDK
jgi:uridylate kinase